MNEVIYIVTDGSAIGNPGPGGWAAVFSQGKKSLDLSGANSWTTISEMELVAAVQALRTIRSRGKIELSSDSEYLIHGMRFHLHRWQAEGWTNRRGRRLQHQDLWEELLRLNGQLNIHWKWVRGHNQHPAQSRADSLAYREARTLWSKLRIAA